MAARTGARLGVDVGGVRIGVAVSDPSGSLATPVETVAAGDGALTRLAALAAEHEVVEVVLGLPRSMSGGEGPAAATARAFGAELAAAVAPVPVRLVDERLSTASAERNLRGGGGRGDGRSGGRAGARAGARHGARRRRVVDQAAAVVILQSALDTESTSGAAPGEVVDAVGRSARPGAPGPRDDRAPR